MSGHMRKHPTKNRANLKRALIEKLAHVVNEEDLIALNNVIDKFIPPKKQSLLPEEVFGKNWTDQNIRLGKIIQGLRFREGLTQVELAKILKGVKQANISSWERGKEKIPSKRLNQLAKIFGTNIKKLLEDNT